MKPTNLVTGVGKRHSLCILPYPTPVQWCHNTFSTLQFSNIERGDGGADTYFVGVTVMISYFCTLISQYNLSMVVVNITNLMEMLILNSSVVWVTLCREKTNLLSEAEFIMKMHEITDKGQLHLSKFATKQFALYMVSFHLVQI